MKQYDKTYISFDANKINTLSEKHLLIERLHVSCHCKLVVGSRAEVVEDIGREFTLRDVHDFWYGDSIFDIDVWWGFPWQVQALWASGASGVRHSSWRRCKMCTTRQWRIDVCDRSSLAYKGKSQDVANSWLKSLDLDVAAIKITGTVGFSKDWYFGLKRFHDTSETSTGLHPSPRTVKAAPLENTL